MMSDLLSEMSELGTRHFNNLVNKVFGYVSPFETISTSWVYAAFARFASLRSRPQEKGPCAATKGRSRKRGVECEYLRERDIHIRCMYIAREGGGGIGRGGLSGWGNREGGIIQREGYRWRDTEEGMQREGGAC